MDGAGGDRLIVYSNAKVRVSGEALAVPVGNAALAFGQVESESKQVFRIFFLNRDGAVYRWAWRGCEGCDECSGDSAVRSRPGTR